MQLQSIWKGDTSAVELDASTLPSNHQQSSFPADFSLFTTPVEAVTPPTSPGQPQQTSSPEVFFSDWEATQKTTESPGASSLGTTETVLHGVPEGIDETEGPSDSEIDTQTMSNVTETIGNGRRTMKLEEDNKKSYSSVKGIRPEELESHFTDADARSDGKGNQPTLAREMTASLIQDTKETELWAMNLPPTGQESLRQKNVTSSVVRTFTGWTKGPALDRHLPSKEDRSRRGFKKRSASNDPSTSRLNHYYGKYQSTTHPNSRTGGAFTEPQTAVSGEIPKAEVGTTTIKGSLNAREESVGSQSSRSVAPQMRRVESLPFKIGPVAQVTSGSNHRNPRLVLDIRQQAVGNEHLLLRGGILIAKGDG